MSTQSDSHIYLVDGSGYIFRAYHALPPLTRKSDGLAVGAVHGFCQMLHKLLQDTKADTKPSHFAVIFDPRGGSFRNKIYADYKANRPPPPEDLVPQFALIRDAVRAFNVPCVELEGFEADDLIATYAAQARDAGFKVTIVSSDKDLMQMVDGQIEMLDTMKNRVIHATQVVEKFGVGPDKVIDVQALAGDSSDNVPGVPGIGIKTASLLINEFGDLDTLLARAGEIKQNKRRENLIEFADQARVSRELVTLDQNAPVEVKFNTFGVATPDAETLLGFLAQMEFTTLTNRIAQALGVGAPPPPSPSTAPTAPAPAPAGDTTPVAHAGAMAAKIAALPVGASAVDASAYETVRDAASLASWLEQAARQGYVAVDTETTSLDPMQADLVGVSLALAPGKACYIPLGHRAHGLGLEITDLDQMPMAQALALLKPMLEAPGILKIGQNLKYDIAVLAGRDITVAPFDDTMLMSYALDSGRGRHGMDDLSQRHLGHLPIPFKQVVGTGKSALTFDLVPIATASVYAAEDADITLRLWQVLKPRLAAEKMMTVYEVLERPLVPVLAAMERAGITVDRAVLSRLSGEFSQKLAALEAEIHHLAGETFNIASPKQLGEILFEKQGIEGGKKTKTGAWATGADVLEGLAGAGHTLPERVLEWRGLAKLKSTYTDALPEFINPKTGRVHTSYSLAATTTGRLSSNDPNLQNIPVRTSDGRRIRSAFVAPPGHKLVSADYSQIELRVLAHIADIGALKQAFADGLDIHAMTASEMFSVPIEGMDPSVRRRAKAINFGIIYGISAFGLANQLGIGRGEAKDYIDTYFARFPGIRDYMEATKQVCREQGYVETAFGRKCHYPEINSKNPAHRAFTERAAINAPIQGTAADIIRRAMVAMPGALERAGVAAVMLLQVHDELIFEAPDAQVGATIDVATRVMVAAPLPAVQLTVKLQVDARAAANWEEAH
ncbi:MAG: DNA polymerase I [Alphaproteobacteria bacterium]